MSGTVPYDAHIVVDQFGYRPGDTKVAVIRNPQAGFDATQKFVPGALYQVRRSNDGAVVFSGEPVPWRGGEVEPSSGDSGWWFDFSSVAVPGSYFIEDIRKNVRSAPFTIDLHVYQPVLKAAMRMYFYQRSGIAKRPPHADACWQDDPSYVGPDQDLAARDITDKENPAKIRDVAGGWFDAGDTNKYVTFAPQPVHQLLTAYQETPAAFTDDFNIPESGNGIPDLLDEVKWETDWLKKMQYPDGSAALKVGEIIYASAAPPSRDRTARYYIPACTSATIAVAGMFAHASWVFATIPALAGEAADLKTRAVAAWNNYQGAPVKQEHCDSGVIHAGNADRTSEEQQAAAVVAAVYLSAITHDSRYDAYVAAHYGDTKPYHDIGWTRYAPEQGEALLFYATRNQGDAALRRTLLADKAKDVAAGNQVYGFRADDDLYRAFMHDSQYHWGSNNPRAGYGNSNLDVNTYDVMPPAGRRDFELRALEILHYFHGVNPFGMVYLSNMSGLGATRSANEIYHTWFARGTRWSDALTSECGPPPGYVPGGPNARAAQAGVPASLMPPVGQPPQKSYKDWNVASPENSWAVTEPAIYYQSGYVKLLSKFVQ
jgi:hypothetical protein